MKIKLSTLLNVVLATFLLTALIYDVAVSRGDDWEPLLPYDPWVDWNDDGCIDIYDKVAVGARFGSCGTPINKTALLLCLHNRLDSLNVTVVELQSKVDALESTVAILETDITMLNATIVDHESRLATLEANYSVTNLKLAPYAIPFNSTYSSVQQQTTDTVFEDMPSMSVTITLNRTSHLIIMFSAEAKVDGDGKYMQILAKVNELMALPGGICLTPIVYDKISDYDLLDYMAYTYNFFQPSVEAGTYIIKIQWKVTAGTGYIDERTLTVIALPA